MACDQRSAGPDMFVCEQHRIASTRVVTSPDTSQNSTPVSVITLVEINRAPSLVTSRPNPPTALPRFVRAAAAPAACCTYRMHGLLQTCSSYCPTRLREGYAEVVASQLRFYYDFRREAPEGVVCRPLPAGCVARTFSGHFTPQPGYLRWSGERTGIRVLRSASGAFVGAVPRVPNSDLGLCRQPTAMDVI